MHELGFDLTYGWDSYSRLKAVWKGAPADSVFTYELTDVRSLPRQGQRLRFTTNHDETAWDQPPITLFGGAAGARAAFVATALLPGVPLLYDGQEVESPQKLGLFEKQAVAWDQPGAVAARSFYRRVIDLARRHPAFAANDLELIATDAPETSSPTDAATSWCSSTRGIARCKCGQVVAILRECEIADGRKAEWCGRFAAALWCRRVGVGELAKLIALKSICALYVVQGTRSKRARQPEDVLGDVGQNEIRRDRRDLV